MLLALIARLMNDGISVQFLSDDMQVGIRLVRGSGPQRYSMQESYSHDTFSIMSEGQLVGILERRAQELMRHEPV